MENYWDHLHLGKMFWNCSLIEVKFLEIPGFCRSYGIIWHTPCPRKMSKMLFSATIQETGLIDNLPSQPLTWLIINPNLQTPRSSPEQRTVNIALGLTGSEFTALLLGWHRAPTFSCTRNVLAEGCLSVGCHFHGKADHCKHIMGHLHTLGHTRILGFSSLRFAKHTKHQHSNTRPLTDSIPYIWQRENWKSVTP